MLARWLYSPEKIDCGECRKIKKGKGKKPPCGQCKMVDGEPIGLIPENYEVWSIIERYHHTFTDGMGGINTHGIEKALELEYVSDEDEPVFYRKIIAYITTALITKNENNK